MILLKICFLVLSLPFLYIGSIHLKAWMETKSAPRDEMFLCPKGHMIRKQDAITFMDQPVCPLCFHENLKTAEKSRG